MNQLIVGLTGGIGSGKTRVSDRLGQLGASIVDTDLIAHQLTQKSGQAMPAIESRFGPESRNADGSMNRDFMRKQLTQSEDCRHALEAILHPLIRHEARRQIEQAQGDYVVVVVPLLVEKGGWSDWMDEIVVVDCPQATQIERVKKRNGWPMAQIEYILGIQAQRADRLKMASHVIENDQSEAQLSAKIDSLHEKLIQKAAKHSKNLHQNHS